MRPFRYHMTTVTAIVAIAFLSSGSVLGEEEEKELEWLTSYETALETAREEGKPILANFTGSDWCPPCIAQEQEVFSTDEFREWAEEHVVLLLLDFPRSKPQSDEVKEQNRELQQKYGVRGLPTIIVLGVDGEEGEDARWVGYGRGMGVEKWIERTQEAVDNATPEDDSGGTA